MNHIPLNGLSQDGSLCLADYMKWTDDIEDAYQAYNEDRQTAQENGLLRDVYVNLVNYRKFYRDIGTDNVEDAYDAMFDDMNKEQRLKNSLKMLPVMESLCCDRERIINVVIYRLKQFIGDDELNKLITECNSCSRHSETKNTHHASSSGDMGCILNNNNPLLSKQMIYESLLDDQERLLKKLTNCLEKYVTDNEMKMLLNPNLCGQMYCIKGMDENNKTASCPAVSFVGQMKRNIAYILDVYHKYKNIFMSHLFGNKCNTCDGPVQHDERDDCKVNVQNQTEQMIYKPNTDMNSQGDSIDPTLTNTSTCENEPSLNELYNLDDQNDQMYDYDIEGACSCIYKITKRYGSVLFAALSSLIVKNIETRHKNKPCHDNLREKIRNPDVPTDETQANACSCGANNIDNVVSQNNWLLQEKRVREEEIRQMMVCVRQINSMLRRRPYTFWTSGQI